MLRLATVNLNARNARGRLALGKRRILLNVGLFSLGVILAGVVADRGLLTSKYFRTREGQSSASGSLTNSEPLETPTDVHSVPAGGPTAYASVAAKAKLTPVETAIPLRPELLAAAIEDGSLESLKLFRPENVRGVYNYETKILPLLKKQALESLLERMSEQDIADWPNAAFHMDGQRTAARKFVDNFSVVNTEMGNYLETAALLFYGLNTSTRDGRVFDVHEYMEEIMLRAEELLAYRRRMAVPARSVLVKSVADDAVFLNILEKKRAEYVAQFLADNPARVNDHLLLLDSVEPRLSGPAIFQAVTLLLRRLSLAATAQVRERIFQKEFQAKTFQRFADLDSGVRTALAELFVMGAVDALEHRNADEAGQLLQTSRSIQPGLPSQPVIATHIARLRVARSGKPLPAAATPRTPELGAVVPSPAKTKATTAADPGLSNSGEAVELAEPAEQAASQLIEDRASRDETLRSPRKRSSLGALSKIAAAEAQAKRQAPGFSWGSAFLWLLGLGALGCFGFYYSQGRFSVWSGSQASELGEIPLSKPLARKESKPEAPNSKRAAPALNLSAYENQGKKASVANFD